jgi:ubiquinone/menaquinone biosynthesis C-methylase UbiE
MGSKSKRKSKMANFYDIHADAFSKSRYSVWQQVKQFLNSLPADSSVLDIGCGNGKNMLYRADLNMIGLEYSQPLVEICHSRNLNVIQGDARCLPFKDNTFDAAIMIAVIHHIPPAEQYAVFSEICRILRPGGRCLITNWAVEQPIGARRTFEVGLNLVSWKGKDAAEPLSYWVINEEMARKMAGSMPDGIRCTSLQLDAGNWTFCLERAVR